MRWDFLVAALLLLALTFLVSFRTTHPDTDGSHEVPSTRSAWLKLHSPRQTRHDNELLRRRMLSSLAELSVPELASHVPQLLASLGHHDNQIRQLALGMLGRLDVRAAFAKHTTTLVDLLGGGDDRVRLFVLQALIVLADIPTIASSSATIFECLSSASPEVSQVTATVLGLLDPEDLAPYMQAAVEVVTQKKDVAAAKALVMSWGPKLESDACKARAGDLACESVLRSLNKLADSDPRLTSF